MIRALYICPNIEKLEKIGAIFEGSLDLNIYFSASIGDALEIIDFERYDAIILDHEDHEEMIGMINEAREKFPFVPLVTITANAGNEELIRLTNAGADYCLLCDHIPKKDEISTAISGAILNSNSRERQIRDDALVIACIGIWTLDCRTGEICLDDTGKKHLNIKDDAVGISLDILKYIINHDDYNSFIKEYYKIMNRKLPILDIRCRVPGGMGITRYVRMKGAVTRVDSKAEPVTVVGTIEDITDSYNDRSGLMNTIDNLKLLAKISRHDIINQITALDSIFVLLETELPKKDHVERAFGMLHEITENIKRQVVFSRIYHNLRSYEPEWIDLNEAVLTSGVSILPNKAILNTDLKNVQVYADPMFEKVFYNLFENSVRHGKKVSEIDVSSGEDADGSLIITVRDNGSGIPDEMKEEIFRSGIGSNTGLGLFLVSEILGITDITIREIGRYGEGAEFEIHVPPGKWQHKKNE